MKAAPAAGRVRARGFAFLLATAVGWGLNWPVMKSLLATLPPLSARGVAGVAGAALLFGLATITRTPLWPPPGLWGRLGLLALLNFATWMGFATLSLLWLSAAEAAIVTYTLPVWVAMLAWPVLGERPTPVRLAALALGLGGVAVLLGASADFGADRWPGYVLALAGAIGFAFGTVLTKRAPLPLGHIPAVFWQVTLGTAVILAIAAATETPHWGLLSPWGWLLMAYMAAVPLCLCYITWFRALALLPASAATVGVLLVPVVGALSAAATLGEPFGLREAVALLLTIGGIVLAARA